MHTTLAYLFLGKPRLHALLLTRVRPRFFDQVGHEIMYAYSGNKHFFTKFYHRQTYKSYEQSRQ